MDPESSLTRFFSEFGYLAPFTILVLCGFGLPIPEEVTMLGSGFLLSQGRVEPLPIVLTCWSATLIGDSIPFWLGRLWGRRALKIRSVRRALNPARIRSLERRFEKNGTTAILACRFIPGLRLPAWFTAGTLGMPYVKFLGLDALGAAVMTPTFIYIGMVSGEKIAELENTVEDLTQILGFVVVAVTAVVLIRWFSRKLPDSRSDVGASRRAEDRGDATETGTHAGVDRRGDSAEAAPRGPDAPEPEDPEIVDGDRP